MTAVNKRRSVILVGGFALAVTALIWAVALLLGAGIVALPLALLASLAPAAAVYWQSDALVLAMTRARPADPVRHARLYNLVDGLCTAAGLPKPAVAVIEDGAANAFTVGRDPKHAVVVVTTGLLDKMSRVELEGVLAHELSHVKSYDILASTLATTLIGVPMLVLGPPAARLLQLVVSPRRETAADVAGVALTRYPPGLASALEKLREEKGMVRTASRATAHLWIQPPLGARAGGAPGGEAGHSVTHPPLDERIQALREL